MMEDPGTGILGGDYQCPQYGSIRRDMCAFTSTEQAIVICYVASTAVCRAVVVYERGASSAWHTRHAAGWRFACPPPLLRAPHAPCRPPAAAGPSSLALFSAPSSAPPRLAGLDGCSPPIAVLKKDTPRRDNSFISPGVYTMVGMSIPMDKQYEFFLCESSANS